MLGCYYSNETSLVEPVNGIILFFKILHLDNLEFLQIL